MSLKSERKRKKSDNLSIKFKMNEAEQIILSHMTDQLKKSHSEAIDRLQDKLAEVILNL
jgi:hypothetical protein